MRLLPILFVLICAPFGAAAATYTWNGSVSALWSNAANWTPAGVPASGDSLTFSEVTSNYATTNDLPAGTAFERVEVLRSGYSLSGNGIVLTKRLYAQLGLGEPPTTLINMPVDVQTHTIETMHGVIINAALSGSGIIERPSLVIRGSHPFSGTFAAGGRVWLESASLRQATFQSVDILGSGSVGAVQGDPLIVPRNYAVGAPADQGILETGSLSLDTGFIALHLDGPEPGTQHAQIRVTGTVELRFMQFEITRTPALVPAPGQVITLIVNDGTDPIVGTLVYEEGSRIHLNGTWYRLSYVGGDGNDLTLTALPGAGQRHDLDGGNRGDILWRNGSTGQVYGVLLSGLSVIGEGTLYTASDLNWQVAATGDFNGDGRADLLYRNDVTGQLYAVLMNGLSVQTEGFVYTVADLNWKVVATGDLDGDGRSDIVYRNDATGQVYSLLMNGLTVQFEGFVYTAPAEWKIVAAGDLNGDGRADLVYRNDATGQVYALLMNGLTVQSEGFVYTVADLNWKIVFAGDFNGDGRSDILYRNEATGQTYALMMSGLAVQSEGFLYNVADLNWKVAAVADYNGDGRADLLWRNTTTGQVYAVLLNGFTVAGEGFVYTVPSASWVSIGR